ncbi:MAG: hypothetical protein HY951_02875, partial [Bacteroidia bacterium]|nr:hypothetical protein [Bacteroidia bacterium]
KDEELFNRANWNIIRDFSSDYKSREFKYLLDNVEIFNNLYTADSVNSKIKTILINSGQNIIYKKELKEEEYTKFKNEIKNIKFANIEEILFRTDLAYYNKKEDWKKYFNLAVEQGDKFYNGVNEFNEISWSIYENSDDIKVIQKAAEWMKKALVGNENKEWAAHDTYASLLFKLKKYEESKTEATKAIEIAKAAGVSEDDYKPTLELIEKIGKIK